MLTLFQATFKNVFVPGTAHKRSFPSTPGLCIKIRLSAQPLIWRRFFILMKIKLIIFQGSALGLILKVRFFLNSEVA